MDFGLDGLDFDGFVLEAGLDVLGRGAACLKAGVLRGVCVPASPAVSIVDMFWTVWSAFLAAGLADEDGGAARFFDFMKVGFTSFGFGAPCCVGCGVNGGCVLSSIQVGVSLGLMISASCPPVPRSMSCLYSKTTCWSFAGTSRSTCAATASQSGSGIFWPMKLLVRTCVLSKPCKVLIAVLSCDDRLWSTARGIWRRIADNGTACGCPPPAACPSWVVTQGRKGLSAGKANGRGFPDA